MAHEQTASESSGNQQILDKLVKGAKEWLVERGWLFDPDLELWHRPGNDKVISDRLVERFPNEIYSLSMKIEGEIPWFCGWSKHINFRDTD